MLLLLYQQFWTITVVYKVSCLWYWSILSAILPCQEKIYPGCISLSLKALNLNLSHSAIMIHYLAKAMWESQFLLAGGQVVFLWVLPLSVALKWSDISVLSRNFYEQCKPLWNYCLKGEGQFDTAPHCLFEVKRFFKALCAVYCI